MTLSNALLRGSAILAAASQSLTAQIPCPASSGRVYHFLKKGPLRNIVQVHGLPMRPG